ncbi:MAG TPA: HAD-IA family hydrolase [Rhizomicrobium sp.]|nr:HAD-IA family hydrolase [Rhizomicrobium sp.]
MPPAFIFDLDGTLVDTAPDLLATMNTILSREGRPTLAPAELRLLVGRGARNLIGEAFRRTGAPADAAKLDALYDAFIADYGSHVAAASRPFPGVAETLERMKADGARMAVLTNKPHGPTKMLIEQLGLGRFFGVVAGQGWRPWLKPDPRLFEAVLSGIGGRSGGAVAIGDSITDVEMARAGDVPVILMSYGYTPEPAASLGADAVLDDFREVPAAARRLLGTA